MGNKKLIPKHQIGKKILKFLEDFGNAQIAGDSGAATSVAIASGYQYNPATLRWEQSNENIEQAKNLQNNLAVLSTFSPTHPVTALTETVAIPAIGKLASKIKLKPRKIKTTTSQFKDPFGREITPTPYPGPDSELINAVDEAQLNVLRDYFSKSKINQIKTTMNWGDAEIAQLQDEILRAVGTKADVQIKGPADGFTIIGEHSGRIKGTGSNAEGYHAVTLNRERMPNLQIAEEAGIHEIGVHGKTLSMKPEDFGKGGYSDQMKEMFPMLAEITQKNAELASELLVPNKLGNYISQFKTSADLERYFDAHNIPWDKWDKFNSKRTYFNYVNAADEKTARAYTGQLYEKLHGPEHKTQNIEQLKQFFTPESVEKFKKAVLGITPVVGINAISNE